MILKSENNGKNHSNDVFFPSSEIDSLRSIGDFDGKEDVGEMSGDLVGLPDAVGIRSIFETFNALSDQHAQLALLTTI